MSAPRKAKRRVIVPNSRAVPPFGWVATTPGEPPDDCSWCGTALLYHHGAWICASCDSFLLWPHQEATA